MSTKQATLIRQTVEKGKIDAVTSIINGEFKPQGKQAGRNLKAAAMLHSFLFTLENGQDLVDHLTDELAPMNDSERADRLDEWFAWAQELTATRVDLDEAIQSVRNYDADASGLAGWALGVAAWEYKRDASAARLAELANGPAQ